MANNSDTDKELEAVLGSHKTSIKIVGAGGAGNNTVTRLLEVGVKDVDVIAVNTDAQDLLFAKADSKILIGKTITNGLGAGSDPSKGNESAKENIEEIENELQGSDMVFITCGLGGGTGTGSAPVIAEVAKKLDALTIAVVTLPFSDEGIVRLENARKGLQQLQKNVDTVIVVQNDKLLDLVPDMPLNQAFKVADEILVNTVKGITELVTEKGLVNLDFADVRTIMQDGGIAMIGFGESKDMEAEEAAEQALQNPLLDVEVDGAKSALINISGGQELSLKAAKTIMQIVAKKLDASAKIIWGARLDETMGNGLRVMLIITCLQSHKKMTSEEIDQVIEKPKLIKAEPAKTFTSATNSEEVISVKTGSPVESEKVVEPPQSGKKVFSDIFIEESASDLELFEESIKGLNLKDTVRNEKNLKNIKNSLTSIHSSAELFGYTNIGEFLTVIEDVVQSALNTEFDLSDNLLNLFKQIPQTLKQMMFEEQGSTKKAKEIQRKLGDIYELVTGKKHNPLLDDTENASGDSKPKSTFSSVRDAVKHIDKLF